MKVAIVIKDEGMLGQLHWCQLLFFSYTSHILDPFHDLDTFLGNSAVVRRGPTLVQQISQGLAMDPVLVAERDRRIADLRATRD